MSRNSRRRAAPPRIYLYDLVRVAGYGDTVFSVRDSGRGAGGAPTTFVLRAADGFSIEAEAQQMHRTGRVESPFRYHEIVEIHAPRHRAEYAAGQRGVVAGISRDDDRDTWGFAVLLENGECHSFDEDELRTTGQMLPDEERDRREGGRTVRIRVDPATSTGEIVGGSIPDDFYKPKPLGISLADLTSFPPVEDGGR